MIKRKLYELFELSWLMMRQNPGGKSPYLQGYLLGFVGTVDVTPALKNGKGKLKVKVGGGATQLKVIDFEGVDPSELTPNDAVEVLENAGFEDCKFSVDQETKRLKLAPLDSKVKFIQIYGDLAAALNFGNGKFHEGKGCYLFASMDGDLKSAAETEEWGEDKKIENDSPTGKKVTYTISGKRGSTQVVLTDRLASREAKQMINGGIWITGDADNPEVYEPAVDSGGDPKKVDVFTYSKILEKYDNTAGDEKYIRERLYIGGTGHMTRSGGSGSMNDSEYTLTFASYTGTDGIEHASPKESDYTQSQYAALGLDGVIETDWEDGMEFEEETPVTPPAPPSVPELEGTVEITGDLLVGETLTADITLLGGTGTPHFSWYSSDDNVTFEHIDDSDNETLELTSGDENNYIKVIVSREGYNGEIESASVGPIESV